MVCAQSEAFTILRKRLNTIPTLMLVALREAYRTEEPTPKLNTLPPCDFGLVRECGGLVSPGTFTIFVKGPVMSAAATAL